MPTPARPGTSPRAWSQVPPRPPATPPGAAVPLLVGAWVALGPATLRAAALPASHPAPVLAIGALALALALATPAGWALARLGVALAAGAAIAAVGEGAVVGAQLALGVALAPWLGQDHPPLPRLPGARAAVPGAAVLAAVSAYQGQVEGARWQPLLPLVLASLLPFLTRLGGNALPRLADRIGVVAGAAVSWVAFELVGLVVVVLPWAWQRSTGIDPLDHERGWVHRDRLDAQPSRPWAPDARRDPPPSARRKRVVWRAVAGLALGGLLLGAAAPDDRPEVAVTVAGGIPAAHRGEAWYPDHVEDLTWLFDERVAVRPLEVYRLLDAETRTVTIRDSYRAGWTPPSCSCRRVRVWLYGGAATFGIGQRDDHTIASELARVAAEEGIVLDVANRGIPGQLHWRNALRFALDLTVDPAPDLVLFYEGAEEVAAAESLAARDLGDIDPPYEPSSEDVYDDVLDSPGRRPGPVPELSPGVGLDLPPAVVGASAADVGAMAGARYDRSLALSDDTAEQAGIPVRYAWEPSRTTRPDAEADTAGDPDEDRRRAATVAAARAELAPRVLDLGDVFDGIDDPLFADDGHHNERGARLVAEALFAELRADLETLARGEEVAP